MQVLCASLLWIVQETSDSLVRTVNEAARREARSVGLAVFRQESPMVLLFDCRRGVETTGGRDGFANAREGVGTAASIVCVGERTPERWVDDTSEDTGEDDRESPPDLVELVPSVLPQFGVVVTSFASCSWKHVSTDGGARN